MTALVEKRSTRSRSSEPWHDAVDAVLNSRARGRPLHALAKPGDNIGLFGWLQHHFEVQFARWLLLREPSALRSGRVPLYICPECGDLGCQALSIRVIEEPDRFVWTDFAYEASYDDGPATEFLAVGPFSFEKRAYQAAIERFAT